MSATSLPSILVTGATGSTGLEVVEALAKSGQFHVLAGVRDVAKARSIKALQLPGVSLVHLDSDAASAASAFRGVTGVYLLTAPRQPSFDVWFDAIQKGGVKHVVYHSAIGAAPSSPMSMGAEHGLHEEALKAQTQVGWTVFQPTFFHQNLDKFHAPLISQYSMYGGSADSGRFSSVDLRDVAAASVAVFSSPSQHSSHTYVLTGDVTTEPIIAAHLTTTLGRPITYAQWSVDEHRAKMKEWGMPDWLAEDELTMNKWKREGAVGTLQPDLEDLLGRKPKTIQEYIEDKADLFKAAK